MSCQRNDGVHKENLHSDHCNRNILVILLLLLYYRVTETRETTGRKKLVKTKVIETTRPVTYPRVT